MGPTQVECGGPNATNLLPNARQGTGQLRSERHLKRTIGALG